MKIAVAIATSGRREILCATIGQLAKQKRSPDFVYICPASAGDLDLACLNEFPGKTEIVSSPRGLPHQRNAIVRRANEADVVVFFDDDFLADDLYLVGIASLFQEEPNLIVATGDVIADGAVGPGISVAEGLSILESAPPIEATPYLRPTYSGYGCNMAVRISIAKENGIEFDENLPLYGWWEDVDYCRRLAPYGLIRRSGRLRGVHLGSKTGRTPGKRLGYSQVANLLYMTAKGSISRRVAFKKIMSNVSANIARSLFPEPWVDRRGRLLGNFLAFLHWCTGRLSPQNAEKL